MKTEVRVAFTDKFWPSVKRLQAREIKQVTKALEHLGRDPNSDSLRLKPVQGDPTGRKYTCRASSDLRLLIFKEGGILLLASAGHHDDIYAQARRLKLAHNEGTGEVQVLERIAPGPSFAAGRSAGTRPAVHDGPRPFDHWGDAELREAGLSGEEVSYLRSCVSEDALLYLGLSDERLDLLLELLSQTPEQWRTPSFDEAADRAGRLVSALTGDGVLRGISALFTADQLEGLASAPIEDWMIFLHPDQRAAVVRHNDGPARVRGSAGTGKTVVALHRASELVRRFRESTPSEESRTILFTTFVATLPAVFDNLYHRLPTTTLDDDIEFVGLHELARIVCVDAGDPVTVDRRIVEGAWARAWMHSPLRDMGFLPQYIRDEIQQVIKGRGITQLKEYLTVERTGRVVRMPESVRRHVWELAEALNERLHNLGAVDDADLLLRARDHARERVVPTYRAAIIDEAQDLSLVGLQLVRSLVNGPGEVDRPDGLLMVGDGAQRIYPGGFTLGQAGVEVRGRTTVLRDNYRNTAQIIEAAMTVAGGETVSDLEEVYKRGSETATANRISNDRPLLVECATGDEELRFIVEEIVRLNQGVGVGFGDIGVLAPTNEQVKQLRVHLTRAGIPVLNLRNYNGESVASVKLGTHHRAKGQKDWSSKSCFSPAWERTTFRGRMVTTGVLKTKRPAPLQLVASS